MKKTLSNIVFFAVIAASVVGIAWCGWSIYAYAQEDEAHEEELAALYRAAGVSGHDEILAGDKSDVDVAALRRENPDCAAWLTIPGTDLAYPVMEPIDDPEYYLRRNFDKQYSEHGVPFVDARCSLDSDNLIIYGHNMQDGSVFALLHEYEDRAFLAAHPLICLTTTEGVRTYRVAAVLRCNASYRDQEWSIYSSLNMSEADFSETVSRLAQNTLTETGVTPVYGHQLLSLSTCFTSDGANRLVIVATEEE